MELDDIGQYAPLIAIAISIITLLVTLGKFVVKRWNESLDDRLNHLLEKCFGEKLGQLEQKVRDLRTQLDTLLTFLLPKDQINDRSSKIHNNDDV